MDRKHTHKGQVAAQNSLRERTKIEILAEKCEISIKISTDSLATQQHLESTLDPLLDLLVFFHSVCPHEVAISAFYRPHSSLHFIVEGCVHLSPLQQGQPPNKSAFYYALLLSVRTRILPMSPLFRGSTAVSHTSIGLPH